MSADHPPLLHLKVPGRPLEPRLPRDLAPGVRGAGVQADVFLPPGYVAPLATVDLTRATRGADGRPVETDVAAAAGQVIALELQGGVTVYTSPENLRATLERVAPDAIDAAGNLHVDGLRQRAEATRGVVGDTVANLVTRVFTLVVGAGADPILDDARERLAKLAGKEAEKRLGASAELGVSRLGTKALMWAIERRLLAEPGLYRWSAPLDASARRIAEGDAGLAADAQSGPLLVFIHGTGSNTDGGFGGLRNRDWARLSRRYPNRIFAFEHRTLSESPIENAIQLAQALPPGATLHLVTHSRGGLVGDLLCLSELAGKDSALIDEYALGFALGEPDPKERQRLQQELTAIYEEQGKQLRDLAKLLAVKKLRIERYVRVAAPSRGTRLASGNLDVFLSGLLNLIGLVPALAGQPIYSAFKRVVLEVAKNRTKPNLVPGIEAMLPESPMARLLARATPQEKMGLAVIAGDIEGGSLLKRLGVFFTDHVFFEAVQNDLVVDTDSMYAGVARPGQAHALFEQGPSVNHFRYFENSSSRDALWSWLSGEPKELAAFQPLRSISEAEREVARGVMRGTGATHLPVVVVLPGTMGSHLSRERKDRIWLDPLDLMNGGLEKIEWNRPDIEAEQLFALFYGDLCEYLANTHRVERFPYDWRQPIGELADRLAAFLKPLLADAALAERPIRLLAHSMGGLVVRGLVARHRDVWDRLMARPGARFVMLGTPNQGSHSMVEALLGKSKTLRMLARADARHGLQGVLDIVGGFPGALQLLPKPGFLDTDDTASRPYFDPAFWSGMKPQMRDFWFGNGVAAVPEPVRLEAGGWLWKQDGIGTPSLPAEHADRVSYVFGCAHSTPCGIEQEGGRWKLRSTPLGDGTVTWASGRIGGVDSFFWMPAEHGSLADTKEYFDSLAELLQHGTPGRLATRPPVTRDAAAAPTILYDAGPPAYPTEQDLSGGLFGAPKPPLRRTRAPRTLEVRVTARDLSGMNKPILVGHYQDDSIAGAEAVIDRAIVGRQLSVEYNLGLYAGPVGSSTVVLLARNEAERRRGSRRGAIVTGLGPYDGTLAAERLTEAVRVGALRYLTQLTSRGEGGDPANGSVPLATLLLGYNSTVNLTIADSVAALVRGVAEANRKFADATGKPLHIGSLEIVELFLDTAISAAYEVVKVAEALQSDGELGCNVVARKQLGQVPGFRIRLEDQRGNSYWPRLHVTGKSSSELNFLFVGARARAEAVKQDLQPGIVEDIVDRQKQAGRYDSELSHALFQQLVPPDLKDAVRRNDRVVLVVDKNTASVPWELMRPGAAPFSVRSAVVRQLATADFRGHVRQSVENRAFVVGDPSTERFGEFFPSIPLPPGKTELEPLEAAEREATKVAQLLEQQGLQVTTAIDRDCQAADVIGRLHKHPYRIVHIAAHGVFEAEHRDRIRRTGVVLSGGRLLTAREIKALENVPDLVFLNCCHLAQMNPLPDTYNQLAYSVACELIEIGVRAVIVAGWAVEDEASRHFAATFYERLLHDGMPFGDAVFEARKSTYELRRSSLTWGAFQAYGDPGWRFDPKRGDAYAPGSVRRDPEFVAPEELLELLRKRSGEIERSDPPLSREEAAEEASQIRVLLEKAPREWREHYDLCTALADFHAALGPEHFTLARSYYAKAIAAGDSRGGAPIRAIEQLANLEARQGEHENDAKLIESAVARLRDLATSVLGMNLETAGEKVLKTTLGDERLALLGSAYKRLAAIRAREILDDGKIEQVKAMEAAIEASARYYGAGAGDPDSPTLNTYRMLNWLSLAALKVRPTQAETFARIAQRCAVQANADYREKGDFWSAMDAANAQLVERLLDRKLAAAEPTVVGELARAYREARTGVPASRKDRDSVLDHIRLLARFHRARASEDPDARLVADRLVDLVNRLEQDAGDNDGGPPASGAAPAEAEQPRAAARRRGGRKRPRGGGSRKR